MRIEFTMSPFEDVWIMDFHQHGGNIIIHVHSVRGTVVQEIAFPRKIAWQVRRALDLLAPKKGREE